MAHRTTPERPHRTARTGWPGRRQAPRFVVATATALVASVVALVGGAGPAAAEARVDTEAELRAAWADPAETEIVLEADIELTECTTPLRDATASIRVTGAGHILHQGCAPTALASAGLGPVTVTDLTVLGPSTGEGSTPGSEPSLVIHGWSDLVRVDVVGAAGPGIQIFAQIALSDSEVRDSGGPGILATGNGAGAVPKVSCSACTVAGNGGTGIDTSTFPGAEVNVFEATIEDNDGAGIDAGGEVAVNRSTMAYNSPGIRGAADVAIANSTITYNSAGVVIEPLEIVPFGQPRAEDPPELSLVHTTIVGNGTGNVTAPVIHTARSVLGSTTGTNCEGAVSSGGWNFSDDETCALDGTGDIEDPATGVPGLEDLADNGGPTWTRLPEIDSPLVGAISADQCVGTSPHDQRGFPRPPVVGGACDIGAVQTDRAACTSPFTDVGSTHPFCHEINWLAEEEGAHGWPDGTYRPGLPASRQALAAFLWRLGGSPDPEPGYPTFVDVPVGHPFHEPISWLASMGFADGYDDGTFRPAEPVSRQAAAALLRRSEGLPEPVGGSADFSDVDDDHPFHDDIEWLVERGVATGYEDGTFRPGDPTSRQAMAAFLSRLART